MFDLNLGLTVWTSLVFLALLGILWKYAWGPILTFVEARESGIQDKLDQAAKEREESASLLSEYHQQLADARRDTQQMIAEGREAGDRIRQEIEEKARVECESLIDRAHESIERDKEVALQALRKESVDLAIAAAAKLIGNRLDDAKDRELIADYIEDLSEHGEEVEA